jgi:hypothetical protein
MMVYLWFGFLLKHLWVMAWQYAGLISMAMLFLFSLWETMHIDLSTVTEQDLAEAEQFIKLLPQAKEELLYVSDYRTKGIQIPQISPKVIELEAILSKAKP